MEVAITLGVIIFVVVLLARNGKKKQRPVPLTPEEQRKRDEADELITVVLPTIHHDK